MEEENNIEIEPAKNQKIENVPAFETYYLGFVRTDNQYEWFCTSMITRDKSAAILWLRRDWVGYKHKKIISFGLPF